MLLFFQHNRILILGVCILSSVTIFLLGGDPKKTEKPIPPTSVQIGEQTYRLEIADTDIKREKGLGERDSLCADCGMLFPFERRGVYVFWMKGMRFPIDIIWLLEEKIVFIQHAVQPDFPDTINPSVSADSVLELNAGAGSGLSVGDTMPFLYK
jgi:uncharacterized membrane protein (UPF0127 family)